MVHHALGTLYEEPALVALVVHVSTLAGLGHLLPQQVRAWGAFAATLPYTTALYVLQPRMPGISGCAIRAVGAAVLLCQHVLAALLRALCP